MNMNEPKLRFKADDGNQFPDWEEKKIDDVATCFAGATPSTKIPEYWEDGTIRWMSSGEVNNGQIHDTEKRISQLGFDKCSTKMVKPNTVVMALAGQGKTRGMVAITRVPLCTNQSLCAIETNDDICDDYLYQYLQTQYNNLRLISSGDGTRGGLNLKLIGGYIVSVPCFAEQQKIADFLSTIDTVIAKQKETVSAWEERKKGVMQKLFSQELRFKADDGNEFPEWEKKKLEDVVEFLDGQRKPLEAGQRVSGKYPYYGASGIIDYVEDYIFDEESILLSEDGANILDRNYRVCFLAKGKYWVNNHAHVLRTMDGNVNGFICEQLESFDYRKYNSGGAQPKLNQATCRAIIMNIPCLAEQQKIADCLASFDEVIEKQKATLAAWEELKKGLLQQMFV